MQVATSIGKLKGIVVFIIGALACMSACSAEPQKLLIKEESPALMEQKLMQDFSQLEQRKLNWEKLISEKRKAEQERLKNLESEKQKGRLPEKWTEENEEIIIIKNQALKRGYISIDELKWAMSILANYESPNRGKGGNAWLMADDFGYARSGVSHPTEKIYYLFTEVIEGDLLPFKAMFYLSIEKENYDEAEIIRRNWIQCLKYFKNLFEYMDKKLGLKSWSEAGKHRDSSLLVIKVTMFLDKLDVVGLTDPLLITLRREMVGALKEKRWDDAQKIQNIIVGRVKELTPPVPPPQPQVQIVEKVIEKPVEKVVEKVVEKETPQRVVVVQPPSEQHLKVEQLPRYGVTDVGRALSVIGGRPLSEKDAATLKLFDILLGR